MPKSERAGSELDDKKPSPWNRFESFGYARTDFSLLSIFEFEHDNRHRVDVSANEKRLFTIQLRDIEESVKRSYQVLYFIFTGSLPVFPLELRPLPEQKKLLALIRRAR